MRKLNDNEEYEFQYMEDGKYVYKIRYQCDDQFYYVSNFDGSDELIESDVEL